MKDIKKENGTQHAVLMDGDCSEKEEIEGLTLSDFQT